MSILKTINYYFLSDISPSLVTRISYFRIFKEKLDLKNPKTLNEKIQWLKLNEYRNNLLVTNCADKYKVREYVDKVSPSILNELLFVYDDVDEIEWDKFPNRFVIKMNHGAGYNIICSDKSKFDIKEADRKLKIWMKQDFWKNYSEVQYRDIEKKILVEKYIEADNEDSLNDYKIYCFHGVPFCTMSCEDRQKGNTKFYYFDIEGKLIPYSKDSIDAINNNVKVKLPSNYQEMIKIASDLSKPFKFVRVDLYSEKNKIIFGELTFTPGAGLDRDRLKEVDKLLGEQLYLEGNK